MLSYTIKTSFVLESANHQYSTYEQMFLWKCQSFWDICCPMFSNTGSGGKGTFEDS